MEFISLYQQENSYVIKAHPVCGFSKYKIRKHTVMFVSICEKAVKLKPPSRNINIPRKLLNDKVGITIVNLLCRINAFTPGL